MDQALYPTTNATSSQFNYVKIHPESIQHMTNGYKTSTISISAAEDNPIPVAITGTHLADAVSLHTSYEHFDSIVFQWNTTVVNGWSAIVDFSQKRPARGVNPTTWIPYTETNTVDNVRIQSLEMLSNLPSVDPSVCFALAVYNVNTTDPSTFVLDTSLGARGPDFWLTLNANGSTVNPVRQLVIAPDPIGRSLALPGNQSVFVLAGPYPIWNLTKPTKTNAIVLVPGNAPGPDPEPPVYCAVMNIRAIVDYKLAQHNQNSLSNKKRPKLST